MALGALPRLDIVKAYIASSNHDIRKQAQDSDKPYGQDVTIGKTTLHTPDCPKPPMKILYICHQSAPRHITYLPTQRVADLSSTIALDPIGKEQIRSPDL